MVALSWAGGLGQNRSGQKMHERDEPERGTIHVRFVSSPLFIPSH